MCVCCILLHRPGQMGPIHLNGSNMILITWSYTLFVNYFQIFSVTFELEPGAVGHTTDFKEANKRLEWGLKKVILIIRFFPLIISIFFNTDLWMFIKNPSVGYFRLIRVILIDNNNGCSILLQVGGGSEHTLRAKLTFSRSYMVHCWQLCFGLMFLLCNELMCLLWAQEISWKKQGLSAWLSPYLCTMLQGFR